MTQQSELAILDRYGGGYIYHSVLRTHWPLSAAHPSLPFPPSSLYSMSEILGIVIWARHGDRQGFYQDPTSYDASATSITPLGEAC